MRHALTILTLLILLPSTAFAVPVSGTLEATAAAGWQGPYAVHLADGRTVEGTGQVTLQHIASFGMLPVVTTGCVVSSNCVAMGDWTQTYLMLAMEGTADLAGLGPMEWSSQGLQLMPGEASPIMSTGIGVRTVLDGVSVYCPAFSFCTNGTLTAGFLPVAGGQALEWVRLAFTGPEIAEAGVDPAASVPEPSSAILLSCGLLVVGVIARRLPAARARCLQVWRSRSGGYSWVGNRPQREPGGGVCGSLLAKRECFSDFFGVFNPYNGRVVSCRS